MAIKKNRINPQSIHNKNINDALQGGISSLIDSIDIDHSSLIPKKSEDFVQKVVKDTKGELVVNEPIHNIMHRFVRYAKSKNFNKIMVLGGFGCVHKNTMIYTEKGLMRISDITSPIRVLSWNEKKHKFQLSLSGGAFPRGIGTLYRTKTKHGEFVSSGKHLIFSLFGKYLSISSLVNIFSYLGIFSLKRASSKQLQTIVDSCLSESHEDTQHYSKINEDYLGDCAALYRQYGQQLIQKANTNQVPPSLQDGTHKLFQNFDLFSSPYEHGTLVQEPERNHLSKYFLSIVYYLIKFSHSILKFCFHHTMQLLFVPFQIQNLFLAFVKSHLINEKVLGVSVEGYNKPYYDMQVLETNNYICENGFIHHNCGKTENLCIGYALYKIAQNPNILIKIVHVSDTEAVKRCRSIRDYISDDEDFKEQAPHVRPTKIWGSERFIVSRSAPSKDGTVEAYSVLGTGIGGRANLVIFDDPQDLKTAVYEPTTRVKIQETINNVWLTRLIPEDQEVILMMNKWSDVDYASFIQMNPSWAWMSLAVSEDKTHYLFKDSFGREYKLPLWSKFNKKALDMRHTELGTRDFNRGYRLIPYSDKDKTFGYFENCCHFGISPKALIENEDEWVFIGGIDFSSTKRPGNIIAIVAAHKKTGMKVPLEVVAIKSSSDLVPYIVRFYREYGAEYIAENNGVQDTIIDLLETDLGSEKYKRYNIKITGFLTGRNKADNDVGLPSIDKEFENKEWMFCFNQKPDINDSMENNVWSRLYYEFVNHPYYSTSDIVMALWFARSGITKIFRGSGGPNVF